MSLEAPAEPPEAPPLDALSAGLRAMGGPRPLLVGTGQFCPWAGWERVGVLALSEAGAPEGLWDGFLPREGVDALRRLLAAGGAAFAGELDFMYATPWSYAWTTPPAPCWVVGREGPVVRTVGDALVVRPTSGITVAIAPASIARIRADLSADWATRTVTIERHGEPTLEVAREYDPIALLDPTYDGINLMCETAWAAQLTRALAAALGVPFSIHPDLG